jgi:uncharacterized membrane protein
MPQRFNTSLANVVTHYVKFANIKITSASVKETLEQNPYYPSLFCLCDTFTQFKVTNNGFKINKEIVNQLEVPFIAYYYIKDIGNDFVLVTNIANDRVNYIHTGSKLVTVSMQIFLENYQEVVWMAEPDENSGEPDYQKKKKKAQWLFIRQKLLWTTGLLLFFMVVSFNNIQSKMFIYLLLIKLSGIALTISLLSIEINKNNPFLKRICNGKKTNNCDTVLGSKAAKIAGISWSEIGTFYFFCSTIFLLSPTLNINLKIGWLAIASYIGAPYILFSMYYQWKVVKKWCRLCLAVQLVLLTELAWSLMAHSKGLSSLVFDTTIAKLVLISITLPLLTLTILISLVKNATERTFYENAYSRLHKNPAVLSGLLQQQQKAPDGWAELGISIGNPKAFNQIIKVCNPYCGPCSETHNEMEELVRNNDIYLKILFNSTNNPEDITGPPVRHLLAISDTNDEKYTKTVLKEWYSSNSKVYDEFAFKFPVKIDVNKQTAAIERMQKWCMEAEITYTPTIYLNGYRLPESYQLKDLQMILQNK